MMRRHTVVPAFAAVRHSVSSYSFGQPDMATGFLPENHYVTRKDAKPSPVRVSKLPNGVRIVTHNLEGPHVAIGAYIEAGAKFDPATAPGLNYVLRWGLSGSNMENSLFQLDRNARAHGASREHAEIRKRFVAIKAETMAGAHWERLAHDIFTSVSAPRFPEWDVERFRDTMDNLREEQRWQQPRDYVVDQLETVAFYREALGNPRTVAPELNAASSHAQLLQQWASYCTPSRVVIAAVNLEHDAVVAAYENCQFVHSAAAPHHAKSQLSLPTTTERNQYQAGNDKTEYENRGKAMGTKPDCDEEIIVALGFLAHGADTSSKNYATSLVTRELAAGRFQESLGLNKDETRHGVESFYRPYADVGLLGATIRSAPGEAQALVKEAALTIRGLAPTAEELAAAKQRALSRFYADHVEVARDYVDFLGTNLVNDTMHRLTLDDLAKNVQDIAASDIKTLTEDFKASRPTLFATGETLKLPSLRQMGL